MDKNPFNFPGGGEFRINSVTWHCGVCDEEHEGSPEQFLTMILLQSIVGEVTPERNVDSLFTKIAMNQVDRDGSKERVLNAAQDELMKLFP